MSKRGGPPSPVPTGKGLRSSAINDEILSDFLTASLHIPSLKLPVSFQSRHLLVSPVDYRSIVSGDCDAVETAKRFASEFGLFVVSGHGVTVTDVEAVERNGGVELRERKRYEVEEEEEGFDFCWAGEEEDDEAIEGSEINPDLRSDSDQHLRNCLEGKERELVAVGKSLVEVFDKGAAGFGSMQVKASSSLMVLKCNVDCQLSKSEAFLNLNQVDNTENAMSLYLPSSKCEVLVQVGTESFVFQAGSDTIVAILGQKLEVDGSVKNLPRKVRFVQLMDDHNSASHHLIVSIGLRLDRVVAVSDQIMVAALIVLIFQLVHWFYKAVQSL